MPLGLIPNPLLQKPAIRQLLSIRDLGLHLCLARIKTQQRRDGVDHVGQTQTGRHHIRVVILDGAEPDAAFVLAHARLDEFLEEGCDDAAGGAPRGCPEGQQGGA